MTFRSPGQRRFQLNLVEALLMGIAVATGAWIAALRMSPACRDDSTLTFYADDAIRELLPIQKTYGPNRHSRNMEEWLIRDFFDDLQGGVFVDVGANHYRDENNTYFLEHNLGWSGVAIDAQHEFAAGYAAHRPRTRFFSYFVSDTSDTNTELFVPPENPLVASADPQFTAREASRGSPRVVRTIRLDDLLTREGIERVDLLSMDIELAEPKALVGFDVGRFRPQLVCIEGHPEVRQAILAYFARHGYVLIGRYLRADPKNLYFMPLPGTSPS